MTIPHTPEAVRPGVIVIASSIEGIDALARLIHQLPSNFPVPVVVHVSGLERRSISRLRGPSWRFASQLDVIYARKGDTLKAGCVYVIPDDEGLVFADVDFLGTSSTVDLRNADSLFKSAADWYRSQVIGIVLSGLGTNGTEGLRAITKVDGRRIIQNPFEANFPSMPTVALVGDDVEHIVTLDEMGNLLKEILAQPQAIDTSLSSFDAEMALSLLVEKASPENLLELNITAILRMVRDQLSMDVVCISRKFGDRFFITHATTQPNFPQILGLSFHQDESICQRVIDGHLPAILPDMEALRSTHNLPVVPLPIGAHMSAFIFHADGTLYGLLCCFHSVPMPDLDYRDHERLQISATHITRVVSEQI